ncbi:putative dinucleotide-binding enzyme [Labrys wisconsinensis]|uniref:Dinucleotide-binding enzyme n=2 Tax=Labrys wisconsinensis TaxID=425677 RepID=A0ABU0JFW3_9HYPH|nr:NAD(P)-binding domain-containing protein [Labrys wisconsinensis]MDQ0473185.1 putative dinucleotide-binding enzyme [Labrys wisconsinensis]
MKIGIIGTGHMGRALGTGWARSGHAVLFGSRDRAKAESAAAAAPSARAGSFAEAAAFGEVVLYTVRDVLPSALLGRADALDGRVVIDCNNRTLGDDGNPSLFRFDRPLPERSSAEIIAEDCPGARVVKAFNTIPSPVIELPRERLASHGVSVFVGADDAGAKAVVIGLAEELGFIGVDAGGLAHAHLVEAAADLLRLEIGPLGRGPYATLSLHVLPEA